MRRGLGRKHTEHGNAPRRAHRTRIVSHLTSGSLCVPSHSSGATAALQADKLVSPKARGIPLLVDDSRATREIDSTRRPRIFLSHVRSGNETGALVNWAPGEIDRLGRARR